MLRNIIIGITLGILAGCAIGEVRAHDDGRYATVDPAVKAWFNKLRSDKGLCCSFADGQRIDDADWDTLGNIKNGGSGYRVRLGGQWIEVPMAALILPNDRPASVQGAVVWPYQDINGGWQIRCFIPGTGA